MKALRDFLFIPSIAKRAFQDMVASRQQIVDDIAVRPTHHFIKIDYDTRMHPFSSYLHGFRNIRVIHPRGITDFPATSDAALQTVMASNIFHPGMMAINFGSPNVATFITEEQEKGKVETTKIDAKSLWREPMTYHGTSGKMQSGLFFVPKNLPDEALKRFNDAANKMIGRTDITCVNTNCRVLQEAGFSIEGVAMDEVVFPNTLMEHLLFRNVYYTDMKGIKHKVHFDILNTTQRTLEQYVEDVDTAVIGTRYRHNHRNSDTEENQKARGEIAKALIKEETDRLARLATGSEQKVSDEDLFRRKITVSVPSFFGNIIGRIWGRHTIFEVDLSDKRREIAQAFEELAKRQDRPVKLPPFPQRHPNCVTRLKKYFFFSGPMIRFFRRHMMGRVDEINLCTQDLFRHLRSTKGASLNYVLLDDKVVLARVHANGEAREVHKIAADWVLSKHALLSGRQDVYTSGEMWYDETTNRYMMNHDSGTYEPTPRHLDVVVNLANRIFGNFFVAANNSKAAA